MKKNEYAQSKDKNTNVPMNINRIRRKLSFFYLMFLRRRYNNNPVPLNLIISARKLAGKTQINPLMKTENNKGRDLNNPGLADAFASFDLGRWVLGSSTLNFVENRIQMLKPDCILEFGSGFSTLCLAYYMRELHKQTTKPVIFSIEQYAKTREQTIGLLKELGLEPWVQVIHAPVVQNAFLGKEILFYQFSSEDITGFLAGRKFDFVLIDGPFATPGSRFAALPLAIPFMSPRSFFYLDDALRDAEIDIAEEWQKLDNIFIKGIILFPKGLLEGMYSGQN